MPRLSCFTPCGQWALSSEPSYVEQFYNLLAQLWGGALDFTEIGSYNEEKLYAAARMCALMWRELEHAGNQAVPAKAYDLIPLLEFDFLLTPGPKDDYIARQNAIAAAKLLPQGARATNVVSLLKTLIGTTFLAYVPSPAGSSRTVRPASPGSGPGAFKDVRIPAKTLQLVDPVSTTGTVWVAYEDIDTSDLPTITWSAGASFSEGQTVLPTTTNANGFYFVATNDGTTGTAEPTWPAQVGATVLDGGVTWQCVAPIAPALVTGDVVVVDAGNTKQMEKVTVLAVANTPPANSNTTPGCLYFQATFANSHDVGAPLTTGHFPYWWSTQRLNYVVLGPGRNQSVAAGAVIGANDPTTRSKVHQLMARVLRAVDQWAIVRPTTAQANGDGTIGPTVVGHEMGTDTIGAVNYTHSV